MKPALRTHLIEIAVTQLLNSHRSTQDRRHTLDLLTFAELVEVSQQVRYHQHLSDLTPQEIWELRTACMPPLCLHEAILLPRTHPQTLYSRTQHLDYQPLPAVLIGVHHRRRAADRIEILAAFRGVQFSITEKTLADWSLSNGDGPPKGIDSAVQGLAHTTYETETERIAAGGEP